MRTNWYHNVIPDLDNYPGDKWYRDHLERNYDIVNLGSSSAVFCFNYEDFPVKAFNWAMKPQSMEYNFKVLKTYFSIIKRGGIVLIPFSPFSGLSVNGKWPERAYDKYYYLLNSQVLENYNRISYRRKQPFYADPLFSLKRIIRDVPKSKMTDNVVICHCTEEFELDAKKWIKSWMKEFNIEDLNAPLSKESQKDRNDRKNITQDIIIFCLERELKPVIVLTPCHPCLNKYFSKEFREHYIYSFMRELDDRVKIIDYLDLVEFKSDDFYYNSFFMNEQGSKVFTKRVLEDLSLL